MMKSAVAVALVVAATAAAATAHAAPPPAKWSATTEGIHARLVVTPTTDDKKRPQIELDLEIENVSDTDGGIPLAWGYLGDMLALQLVDAAGKPVGLGTEMGGSYASGPPYIVNLPVGATIHIPISKTALEYVSPGKTLFRPLSFQGWDLPAKHGKLTLHAKLSPHALDKAATSAPRAWKTAIELPAIDLP